MKSSIKHCVLCKDTNEKNLIVNAVAKNGTKHRVCRKCNAKRMATYYKTARGRQKVQTAVYKSIKKHWRKQSARLKLNYLVLRGKITRPSICESCGRKEKIEGHHLNYNQPTKVVWLCKDCHRELH